MSKAFTIKLRVKYSTGVIDDLEFIVVASNSHQAIEVLLISPKIPNTNATLLSIIIETYNGELIVEAS